MARRLLVIAVLAAIVGVGLLITVTQGLWGRFTNGVRVNNIARSMADFDLPDGYEADYALEVLGYSIAAYRFDETEHLVLFQVPEGMPLDKQVLTGFIANGQRDADWLDATMVTTETRTVRGEPATVSASERTNGDGKSYRQLNMTFAGRNGPVLLLINQPAERWNDAAIEAFIASIH